MMSTELLNSDANVKSISGLALCNGEVEIAVGKVNYFK